MQNTNIVLMVEPVAFGYNAQTAENNYFQVNHQNESTQTDALQEFTAFRKKLEAAGVEVIVIQDTPEPHTPDSIFPNNWISFGSDGTVTLYPMFAPNRRDERRMDILDSLRERGFQISAVRDLTALEQENKFLEGTGSIIFDHDHKLAYGSVSLRLDEGEFRKFCEEIGYEPVVFSSFQTLDTQRLPIYHTNVMMCVAKEFVVICLDAIDNEMEREKVQEIIKGSGKEIIEISEEQLQNFAGNMLEVKDNEGQTLLVMSETAYKSLTAEQIAAIEQYSKILYADLHTIEKNGGGSARCMLAEVFLPRK